MSTYRKRIEAASVYDVAIQSPLEAAPQLSERLGNTVLLKREDLQPVHSFKLRGAYNKVAKLSAEQRSRGVICASAGNHAQGLALAASRAGIKSLIVMPRTTPSIKVEAVKRLGGRILLHGDTYDEAYEEAQRQAKARGMSFVHPYDDPDVIAGQGTVGMEILRQHPGKLDAVFVPVGGGGFIAGVAAYIKAVRPKVKIIGVEPEDAACLQAALKAGKRVVLDQIGLFADGVAVRQAGAEPFKLARRYVDEVITASVDEICAATRDIFEENRSLAEPAGALALAGLKNYVARKKWSGRTLVAIESGSNVNFDRLRHIAERAEIGEHREALLAVTIPERPGSFRQFCADLGKRGITEFNYRYADRQAAHIFVGVRLQDGVNEKDDLIAGLRSGGYAVLDLTDNEMAKVHVRYMVGGRASGVDHETLFRFEFPERPGALLQFLDKIGSRWNISLFHYRNHGAAYGRVLVGMQVPPKELRECRRKLDEIGYEYAEESDNRAYDLFLGSA
jgi:threonine dehydratase